MGRQYDCFDICPEFYNLIQNPSALAEALGCADAEDMLELYEMTTSDLDVLKNKLKYWNDVVPSGYERKDVYIVPNDILTWQEDMLLLDANEIICNGENGGYNVFTLSTEAWGML